MENKERKFLPLVIAASIAIPLVVALLYFLPKGHIEGLSKGTLPALNATINAITSLVLVAAFLAIKEKNIILHKRLMKTAIFLSLVFLVSYVLHHATAEQTVFGGTGWVKTTYLIILISHIILAIAIVPLVLISYVRAISDKIDKHRKIARITLPLWLYVTITGVVVYFMISPYY
jgi:putative membrane protein